MWRLDPSSNGRDCRKARATARVAPEGVARLLGALSRDTEQGFIIFAAVRVSRTARR